MSLPGFSKGAPLTADALNVLAARVRDLQQRAAGGGVFLRGMAARCVPGRQFAFRLAVLNGLVWVRRGWVDAGHGRLFAVGEEEWTALGPVKGMTVWLEISEFQGAVVVTDYDEVTPETNLRRRLGYVREVDAADGNGQVLHLVQLLGGLVTPAAPRRAMGMNTMTGEFSKGDRCWDWVRAGNLRGTDVTVAPGHYAGGRSVGMGYMMDVMATHFPASEGGARLTQVMRLCGGA